MSRIIVGIFLTALVIVAGMVMLQPAHASASAVMQNTTRYIDSLGYLHIFGEIQNTGDVWLNFVKITCTLKNASGQVVDVIYTFTYASYLSPGQKAPFNLIELDVSKSAKATLFDLVLEYSQVSAPPQNALIIQSTSGSIDSIGFFEIVGQVKNNGPQISNFTEVIATFYDSSGLVVYAAFSFTSPSDLPPGQAYGFKIIGPSQPVSGRVTRFALTAQSNQFTSMPEFPWPAVGMTIAVTVVAVAVRRERRTTRVQERKHLLR